MAHTAELISTGAELLSGRTVNRHAHTLGQALIPRGFTLVRDTTVPDDLDQICEALRGAMQRVDMVFISGGLGPTSDDITRDALAMVLAQDLVIDPGALSQLTERYEKAGRSVTEMAQRQVRVLEKAEVLLNPAGLAPGQRLEGPGGQVLFVLPGPPHEFSSVLETHILPWLSSNRPPDSPVLERLFMVGAVPEAMVAQRFEQAGFPPDGVTIGYCAAPGRVEVRLNGCDAHLLDRCAEQARTMLADDVYAESRMPIQEVVIRGLTHGHLTLATIEGASDGLLARFLSSAPESRGVYTGGLVTGRNHPLIDLCGVSSSLIRDQGAISEPVAGQLAAAIRDQWSSDIGLAVTDSSRRHPDKPDGRFYIGIAHGSQTQVSAHRFAGRGAWQAEWIAHIALNQLRRTLGLGSPPTGSASAAPGERPCAE